MFNLFGNKNIKKDPNSICVNLDLNAKHTPLSNSLVNLYAILITDGFIVHFNGRMKYTITDEAFENLCAKWGVYQDERIPQVDSIMPITSPYWIPSALLYKCRLDDVYDIEEYLRKHDLGTKEYTSALCLNERLDALDTLIGELDEQLDSGTIELDEADRRIKAIKKEYKKIKKEVKKNERYND